MQAPRILSAEKLGAWGKEQGVKLLNFLFHAPGSQLLAQWASKLSKPAIAANPNVWLVLAAEIDGETSGRNGRAI